MLHGGSQQETCRLLASCIAAIQVWTVENKLSLDVAKTDSLTMSVKKAAVPESMIDFGEEMIISSASVRNLGAIFNGNRKMDKHASDLCRRGFYHIRRIALIHKYLNHDSTARLISFSTVGKKITALSLASASSQTREKKILLELFSQLSHFRIELPFHYMSIDRSFVEG